MKYYTYYQNPNYISNSGMGDWLKTYRGTTETPEQTVAKFKNYDKGNLFDFAITEPHRLDNSNKSMIKEVGGETVYFDDKTWASNDKMKTAFLNSPAAVFLKYANTQHEYYKTIHFENKGIAISQKVKCKFDLLIKRMKKGADIKTTAAGSHAQFKKSIWLFEYQRQAAFYMDIADLEEFYFFGVSKTKHEVYYEKVTRDSNFYKVGEQQYKEILFNMNLLNF